MCRTKAKDAGCPLAQDDVQSALWLLLQPFSGSTALSAGTDVICLIIKYLLSLTILRLKST